MPNRTDSIDAINGDPTLVYISDIHGYYADTQAALTTLADTEAYEPLVTLVESGTLHWADNDYVLVINGDVIDRGPANDTCLELLWRLIEEAPAGRVQYHIGNHEMAILLPVLVNWPDTYSTGLSDDRRRKFLQRIIDGDVTAAYEGHRHTISHAGSNEAIDISTVNDSLQEAAETLQTAIGDKHEPRVQQRVADQYERLFKLGENGGRGPSAGLCWLDFAHLEKSAPPQFVGHTMHHNPVRSGNVICGNVIRMNQGSPHGEGVLLETTETITFAQRQADGSVAIKDV